MNSPSRKIEPRKARISDSIFHRPLEIRARTPKPPELAFQQAAEAVANKKGHLNHQVALSSQKANILLFCHKRQQTNEPSPQDSGSNGTLIQSSGACSASWKNTTFAINQISQGLQILVVHIHWTRYFTMPSKHAAHLFLFQTSAAFTKFLQICAGNCCHVTTYSL